MANTDSKNLQSCLRIAAALKTIETEYLDVEERAKGIRYMPDFFDLNGQLLENMTGSINTQNLNQEEWLQYSLQSKFLYQRMRTNGAELCAMADNTSGNLWEAYEAFMASLEQQMLPFAGQKTPFFPCGFSSMEMHIPQISFLGMLFQDEDYFSLENYIYKDGVLSIDITEAQAKFGLTGQEYEIFATAYAAAYPILRDTLKVSGQMHSFID